MSKYFTIGMLVCISMLLNSVFADDGNPARENFDQPKCIDSGDIDRVWHMFSFRAWNKAKQKWVKIKAPGPCENDSLEFKVVEAFLFLEKIPAIAQVPELSAGPAKYLRQRIKEIRIEESAVSKECREPSFVAFVPYYSNTMHVCAGAKKLAESMALWSYMLVHEARHVDGFDHVSCIYGDFATKKGKLRVCDTSYQSRGSYSVGIDYWLAMARAKSIPTALRNEAKVLAVVDLFIRFRKLPLGLSEGVLLLSKARNLYYFNGTSKILLAANLRENTNVSMRQSLPYLFDPHFGTVKVVTAEEEILDAPLYNAFAQRYRNYQPQKRESILDLLFYPQYDCELFREKMICYKEKEKTIVEFGTFRPITFLRGKKSSLLGSDRPHLVDASGELFSLPKSFNELKQKKTNALKKVGNPQGIMGLAGFKDHELALFPDGSLKLFSPATKSWQTPPELENETFEKVLGPILWSPLLKDL